MDGPRHIWWNFVSSRKDRIEQAKAEWKAGRFENVPGDEIEFIPAAGEVASHDQEQIGVAGLLAAGRDHGMGLTAVVGLVIEEMRHQEAARPAHLAIDRAAEPDLILRKPCIGDAPCPA